MLPEMPLLIGNQTSFAAGSPLEPFEFAVAHQFRAFEFFPDRGPKGRGGWGEEDLDTSARRSIRQRADQHDIVLTVHAPLEMDLLREAGGGLLSRTIEFASEIQARLLNVHLELREGLQRFVAALGPACRLTAEAGIQLAVENTVYTGPQDFNRFFAELGRCRGLPTGHVGMTFDLGHANLYGATQNDYWRYLDTLAAELPLIHLHLHENFGDWDSHLPLFTGPSRQNATGLAGLLERLQQRGFDGCAILEQWPRPPSLLLQARDGLMQMLPRPAAIPIHS
jgi:sugar phosphate isomerase/epimerase